MEYHGGKLTRSLCLSAHAPEWLRHKRCHLELWEMFDLSACLGSARDSSLPADVRWGSFVTHSFLPHGPWGRNERVTNETNPNGRLRGG